MSASGAQCYFAPLLLPMVKPSWVRFLCCAPVNHSQKLRLLIISLQCNIGINADPGIGTDASKVVADCIHSSRVKEMGQALLKKSPRVAAEDLSSDLFQSADRLGEDEVVKYQSKLGRAIVVFLELLHLLIARNRDLLLNVIQERRKETPATAPFPPSTTAGRSQSQTQGAYASGNRSFARAGSFDGSVDPKDPRIIRSISEEVMRNKLSGDDRSRTGGSGGGDDHSQSAASLAGGAGMRCDSAIALQSELQRAFIALTKNLYPGISLIMQSETPRWLKQCCQENYFR